MKDIFTLAYNNSRYPEIFSVFEKELIQTLVSHTRNGTKIALIKEPLYSTLVMANPAIEASRFIYSWKQSLNELTVENHPLLKKIEEQLLIATLSSISKHLEPNFIHNIILIDISEHIGNTFAVYKQLIKLGLPFNRLDKLIYEPTNFVETKSILISLGCTDRRTFSDLAEAFFSVTHTLTRRSSIIKIGKEQSENTFNQRLSETINSILNYSYNHKRSDLNFLLGIFLDIASMNNDEVTKLVLGGYGVIPYLPNLKKPTCAAIIERHYPQEDYTIYELFIKGHGIVIHLQYDEFNTIIKYNSYDTKRKEAHEFFGLEFCVDDDFLEGANLDLFQMAASDYENVKVITEFPYDYERLSTIDRCEERPGQPKFESHLNDYLASRGLK